MANPETVAPRAREVAVLCALLAILIFSVFGQTLHHGFVNYDDDQYVDSNPLVTSGLTVAGVEQAFTRRELGLWTPLVTVSHMLDCQLYGLNAGGHHLTNVLLHAASAIVLFLILRQMTGSLWRSWFVAAVFAIHPLRVESVAWIAERKDVLSGLFFMLTLAAYAGYVRRRGSRFHYCAAVVLFALGLMCKPMLVTLPFVLLLLDYWPLNRLLAVPANPAEPSRRFPVDWRVVVEKVPFLALSCGSCVVTMLAPPGNAPSDVEPVPFWTRMAEAPASFVIYLCQVVWPKGLAVIYTHPEAGLPWAAPALALLALISVAAFLLRGKHPYLWMGWLWNLGMLAPVSGLVQISRHARADHYTYLPQIGVYIGLTWAVADWARERPRLRPAIGSIAMVGLSVLALAAWRQTTFWRNSITLWTKTLRCTRDNYIAHNNLGPALLRLGRKDEAIAHYQEALRLDPSYASADYNLGIALARQGLLEEAMAHYREALRIFPGYAQAHNNLGNALARQGRIEEATAHYQEALRLDPSFADAHNNLGSLLARQGQWEEAMAHFRKALQFDPVNAKAHNNLGNALAEQGRLEEAMAHYREALQLDPTYADAHDNLGMLLYREGKEDEAISELQTALKLDPASPTVQNHLAWMLVTASQKSLRDGQRAVRLATQASQSTGGRNPDFLRTLAAAYAEAGQFPNAVQTAQDALQLAEAASNPKLASALRQEIGRYAAGHRLGEAH